MVDRTSVESTPRSTTRYRRWFCTSVGHLHAFPERYIALDVFGVRLGLRVVPRGVAVCLAAGNNVVVAGRALPRADRVGLRRFEVFVVDAAGREVVIPLDNHGVVALGKY